MAARHKMTTASSRRMKSRYFRLARRGLGVFLGFWLVLSSPAPCGSTSAAESEAGQGQGLKPILEYISSAWDTLTRSMSECESVADPKIKAAPTIYLPAGFAEPDALKKLTMKCDVRVEHLPIVIHHLGEIDTAKLQPPGLLYLENKYVVPGGRFNEMYGWDSYFIIRGLLRAGRVELARGMVDNFFFEVENYGAMLNANRTYYLTRSQPPFLSSMFVDVYDALQKSGHADTRLAGEGLCRSRQGLRNVESRSSPCRRDGLVALFRFRGRSAAGGRAGRRLDFIARLRLIFSFIPPKRMTTFTRTCLGPSSPVAGSPYTLQICDVSHTMARAACDEPHEYKLSSDYYKGDRSMRESGFDVSFRFGPFGAGHSSLRAGVPEQLALQDRERYGADQPVAGTQRRRRQVERARGEAQATDHPLSVG